MILLSHLNNRVSFFLLGVVGYPSSMSEKILLKKDY
jgi:hypothetical protein